MHLDRFDFSGNLGRAKSKCIPGFIIPVRRSQGTDANLKTSWRGTRSGLSGAFGACGLGREPPRGTVQVRQHVGREKYTVAVTQPEMMGTTKAFAGL
jgi:hypothetical protein